MKTLYVNDCFVLLSSLIKLFPVIYVLSLCAGIFSVRHVLFCPPWDCGRRQNERYDSTGLFTVTYQLIYRHCTYMYCPGLLEYVHPLV